jgi:hypothetical protein
VITLAKAARSRSRRDQSTTPTLTPPTPCRLRSPLRHRRGPPSSFRNAYTYGPGIAPNPRSDPRYGLAVSIECSWQAHLLLCRHHQTRRHSPSPARPVFLWEAAGTPNQRLRHTGELLRPSAMRTRTDRFSPNTFDPAPGMASQSASKVHGKPRPPTSASRVSRRRQPTVNPWHRRVGVVALDRQRLRGSLR